jgi:putative serine protease PepD
MQTTLYPHAPADPYAGERPTYDREPGRTWLAPDAPTRTRRPWRLFAASTAAAAVLGGLVGAGATAALDSGPAPSSAAPAAAAAGAAGGSAVSEIAAEVLPSVVSISVRSAWGGGTGSGFVLDTEGHVLTNNHVVAGADQVTVVLNDGTGVAAEIVGTAPNSDVAVLQLVDPPADLVPATLGASDGLAVGDQVLAVGSPLGLSGTVTSGIVSALDRPVELGQGGSVGAIQTDASINPGNSGGPLVDAAGRVVGVNTAIATLGGQSGGNIGIGFAIPIERAADVANQLISS